MEIETKSSSCSLEKKSKKQKKQPSWDEKEDVTLIIEVLEREHALFGDIKGSGAKSVHRKRQECWQEVVDILQSRFVTVKRDVEEVKKKYQNIKQRCKGKIDRIKAVMGRTGGGPPPADLTPVELTFYERMCHRPSVQGLSGGVDTDAQDRDINDPSTSTSASFNEPSPSDSSESVREVAECEVEGTNKKGQRKQTQQEITYINTEKDTKRIMLESRKIEKEIEMLEAKKIKLEIETAKLKSERETWEAKKIYYQLKIQNDFGMNIAFD